MAFRSNLSVAEFAIEVGLQSHAQNHELVLKQTVNKTEEKSHKFEEGNLRPGEQECVIFGTRLNLVIIAGLYAS